MNWTNPKDSALRGDRPSDALTLGIARLMEGLRAQQNDADRLGLDLVGIRIAEALDQLMDEVSARQQRPVGIKIH